MIYLQVWLYMTLALVVAAGSGTMHPGTVIVMSALAAVGLFLFAAFSRKGEHEAGE